MTRLNFDSLDEDTLILILPNLAVSDLLSVRRTCQRLRRITLLHTVWRNACIRNILQPGFPFPSVSLDSLTSTELERYTRLAHRLATRWLSLSLPAHRPAARGQEPAQHVDWLSLTKEIKFIAASSTEITAVRFLPGRKERYLLTVSKGIWSTLSLWQIDEPGSPTRTVPRERATWSPKGALFNRFALNTDVTSEAAIAVSVFSEGRHSTIILTLEGVGGLGDSVECAVDLAGTEGVKASTFRVISTVDTNLEPMEMEGDVIAFSDKSSETVVFNWRTGKMGLLQHEPEEGVFKHDPCVQVVFAHQSVLVLRARSMHLFPQPTLVDPDDVTPTRPIAQHSFGWVDGISAVIPAQSIGGKDDNSLARTSIKILCRAPNHDPWSSNVCTLDLYTLSSNPDFTPDPKGSGDAGACVSPYIFPPRLTAQVSSGRGPLRCLDIVLGKYGTAVWVHPRDNTTHGLISGDTHLQEIPLQRPAWSDERLVAAVFAGPLRGALEAVDASGGNNSGVGGVHRQGVEGVGVKTVARNEAGSWTAMDYDEDMGRIALGTSFGGLTVFEI